MSGGEISGNDAFYGGGVLVASGFVPSVVSEATFIMDNGRISGNTSRIAGGGVYLEGERVTFTMEGGEISDNTSLSSGDYGGGGVYMEGYSFTMKGGKISKNIASYGGGVYVGSGVFNMYGPGEISGNSVSNAGGGVYIGEVGGFRMTDGTIYGSNASNSQKNRTSYDDAGAAIYSSSLDAKYGTLNSSNVFTQTGTFTENDENTVKVVNGALVP